MKRDGYLNLLPPMMAPNRAPPSHKPSEDSVLRQKALDADLMKIEALKQRRMDTAAANPPATKARRPLQK